MKYRLFIVEQGVWLPVMDWPRTNGYLEFDDPEVAKQEALRRVDDATKNDVVVMGAPIGVAKFGGDGEAYWKDLP